MIEYERKYRINEQQKRSINQMTPGLSEAPLLHQVDEVFLYQKDSFETFIPGEAVVRIRTENNDTKLTYKRAINQQGDSIEHEIGIAVGGDGVLRQILEDMGYHQVTRVEKYRREIMRNGITVTLDDVVGLGDFAEIEIVAASDKQAEKKISERALELGLTAADVETRKYDRLLALQKS